MATTKNKKFHIPFHKSLFLTISSLFVCFVVVAVALQYYQEKNFRQENLNTLLQEYNAYICSRLSDGLDVTEQATDSLLRLKGVYPLGVTIIDIATGNVLIDTRREEPIEEPHLNRPEVQAAIAGTENAYTIRYSETMKKPYFYAAHRYGDVIIRTSIPFDRTTFDIFHVNPMFRYTMIGLAFIFILALFFFCRSLGRSITALDTIVQQARQGLPLKISATPDNTIGRITQNLRQIYENLRQTREDLAREEEKLLLHIQMSREGIAIFTQDRQLIVSNNLFIQYLTHLTDAPINGDPSRIFDEKELAEVIDFVTQPKEVQEDGGKAAVKQIHIHKNGHSFDIRGILFHDTSFEISIFDNTEREREDLLKKQLTQNIAHELKTPVSGIRGYLETILSTPDIDPDKRNLFMERCYAQARRLSDLLHDISMLNRLDESTDLFDRQTIDLAHVIKDVIGETANTLESKAMSVNLHNIETPMLIEGNYALLYSIFRNLTDNAAAYAGEGTQIQINCYLTNEKYYYISFSDNGCGVDEIHLQRLFERFYRVDKGRSRKLGGTGLGLAIVKNAVLFHGGEVMAKNAASGGLEILFTLRKK